MRVVLVLVLVLLPFPAAATSRTGILVPEMLEAYDPATEQVGPRAPTTYALHRGRRRVRVAPDGRYLPGATLKVRGTVQPDGVLAPDLDDRGVRVLRMPPQTPAFPVERLLVLPVLATGMAPPKTPAELLASFTRLAQRIAESSYGRTTMTVTVKDWAALAPASDCGYWPQLEHAMAVHAATTDFRAYTLVVVVEAEGTCAERPYGIGGGVARMPLRTPNGTAVLGTAITGASWAASLHEVGHALGLLHANRLACAVPGVPIPDCAGCRNIEYGDPYDLMGQSLGDFHVLHKRQLGWVRAIGPETTQTVTTPGTYVLEPLEVPAMGLGPKGLFLPLPTVPASWLVLEARTPVGLDRLYPDDWFAGVIVHGAFAGLLLPNLAGEIEAQPATSSHYVRLLPTGSTQIFGPWQVRVVRRTGSPPLVTVAINEATVPQPTATPAPQPTSTCCLASTGACAPGQLVCPPLATCCPTGSPVCFPNTPPCP